MSASTTPNQNASLSPQSEYPPKDTDSASRNAPERKLTALQRINSFIGKQEPPKFPPDSWTTEGISAGGAQGSDTVPKFVADRAPTPTGTPPPDAPEAQTLANRIRMALATAVAPSDASIASPGGTAAPSMDERFKAWLSSDSVMNGAGATSVWAYLDNLNPMKPKPSLDSKTWTTAKDGAAESDDDDTDSLMMYGPLEPTENSPVQIAEREIVDEDSDLPGHKESTSASSSADGKGASDEKVPKGKKVKKVWVPSPTQVSLETAWWGYRIYLPPPVMERLNTYQPIAAKKAAVISTSLKWILDKVPTLMVPPPLRPALMLLKRLTPLLGSIGVFVAWSWGRIASQDKGHGVYLSATWLLPVALIPATWDLSDNHLPSTSEGAKKVDPSSAEMTSGQAPETAAPATETVESPTSTKGSIFSVFGSLKGKKKAE